jgi:hypothetical protein
MLPASFLLGYIAALMVSGVLLLVLGGVGFRQGTGARIVEFVVGLAFLAYAAYLLFFFEDGRVGLALWVLLAPALALSNIARIRREHRIRQEQLAATYAAEAADRAAASR